jgi:hypothetical protein
MRPFARRTDDERPGGEQREVLCERYEALRAAALAARPEAFSHGLGLLLGRGVAGWIAAARQLAPIPEAERAVAVADPEPAPADGRQRQLVSVLAAMALVCAGQ